MATFYSILSASVRPEIQEKITIGLFLMDDKEAFFEYSKNKLLSAKSLFSDNAYYSLKDGLKNIEITLEKQFIANKRQGLDFDKKTILTNSYIEYLSKYNNNILTFSSPKEIELDTNAAIFSNLYKKFIDSSEETPEINSTPVFETFIISKREVLAQYFNIDKEITYKDVPNLIVPVKITLIGQNEATTFLQSLDMNKRIDILSGNISEILFLQKAFSTSHVKSTAMAITQEPNKKLFQKQHNIWKQLRNIKDIKTYDISEAGKVIEYAEKHNMRPFLKEKTQD